MELIIAPFNAVYIICWVVAILAMVGIGLGFRKASEKTKTVFILCLCAFTVVVYFIYKAILVGDAAYAAALNKKQGITDYGWFYELPVQLCNINMFLIPIGVLTKKRGIMGFSFFLAPLGAAMALLFPSDGFSGESLLRPGVAGFYLTHFLIVTAGISLATLGFFRPKFKDFPKVFLTLVCISAAVHLINLGLIYTHLAEKANYFFTMRDEGISILALFSKITTVPYLYLFPAIGIMAVYMSLITLVFTVFGKKNKNK